jgi:hypothetical protein
MQERVLKNWCQSGFDVDQTLSFPRQGKAGFDFSGKAFSAVMSALQQSNMSLHIYTWQGEHLKQAVP